MLNKIFIIAVLMVIGLIPNAVLAETFSQCGARPFLLKSFDVVEYRKCLALTKECAGEKIPEKQQACINDIANHASECGQLRQLFQKLGLKTATIKIRQAGPVALIAVSLVKDGPAHYFIVDSDGCIIDTISDPRCLDRTLIEKFRAQKITIANQGEPTYRFDTDDSQEFTVPLEVREACAGCGVIGRVEMKLKFSKEGRYVDTTVGAFEPGSAKSETAN